MRGEEIKEGQESTLTDKHESSQLKWQGYVGIGGREAYNLEKFRVGGRVIRAEDRKDANLDSVTEEGCIHFGMLIGTSVSHLS